jgi:cell division protein FtsN
MAKPATRNSGRSGGRSVFTGVLIGLTFGAILAVGVALWVTGSNPFKSSSLKPAALRHEPTAPAAPEVAPSFDFYKVLPGDTNSEMPPKPGATATTPLYYLQAGAFQNPTDADNLKAQLALLGVEATIQTRELGDKGVFHRVRVGPFHAMDEINRTRTLLTQNNIPVTLVKEVPTQQETH